MARRRTIKDDGPDPIDKFVGSRVRARRVGLRISQTKLGDAIGVTFQQVQKYENGTNRIGASNLFKISSRIIYQLYKNRTRRRVKIRPHMSYTGMDLNRD